MHIGPPRFSIRITSARPATTSKSRRKRLSFAIRDSLPSPPPRGGSIIVAFDVELSDRARRRKGVGQEQQRFNSDSRRFHFCFLFSSSFTDCKEMEDGNWARFACNSRETAMALVSSSPRTDAPVATALLSASCRGCCDSRRLWVLIYQNSLHRELVRAYTGCPDGPIPPLAVFQEFLLRISYILRKIQFQNVIQFQNTPIWEQSHLLLHLGT